MDIKVKKVRADLLLLRQFPGQTLDQVKKLILAGLIRSSENNVIKKTSDMIPANAILTIYKKPQYVSRGAIKLKSALDEYLPDLTGKVAADIGVSTGGFTDLMLQYGVLKVYAIDVGYGQLHYKLRRNPKIVLMEGINARQIIPSSLPEQVDIITMDLSFISVIKVLKNITLILKKNGWAFILVKPQFEAKKSEVGHGGVVRDTNIHKKCIDKVKAFTEHELCWTTLDVIPSTILGAKGNQEFILVCKK